MDKENEADVLSWSYGLHLGFTSRALEVALGYTCFAGRQRYSRLMLRYEDGYVFQQAICTVDRPFNLIGHSPPIFSPLISSSLSALPPSNLTHPSTGLTTTPTPSFPTTLNCPSPVCGPATHQQSPSPGHRYNSTQPPGLSSPKRNSSRRIRPNTALVSVRPTRGRRGLVLRKGRRSRREGWSRRGFGISWVVMAGMKMIGGRRRRGGWWSLRRGR